MQELKGTENELRQLLTASNARNEEMELQVFEQEEQLEKLKTELDNVTKGKRRFFLKNLLLSHFYKARAQAALVVLLLLSQFVKFV